MAKVVRFHELGGPDVLRLEEIDLGEPGPGEVLLDVDAIGLNRSEANFRRDRYLDRVAALPSGLGYEGAGRVRAVGGDVTGFAPGDTVSVLPLFQQSRHHMYGEQAIVPASALVHRPPSVSAVTGAAVWMPFLTAYGALLDIGRLRPGDHVVITAASSSVGLAALQVARRAGAIPIATTNDVDKEKRLSEAGAAHTVVTGRDDVATTILDITAGRGAEMVFDAVAGTGIEALAAATARDGLLFVHGGLSGEPTPLPGLRGMRPVFTRPYTVFEITGDPDRLARARHYITDGLDAGVLTPVIDRTFDLDDIVAAHRYLEAGQQVGKIVVTVAREEAQR
ncbi:zinc-dependent alcohol dehydrogenase family protein [Streptomyces sp. SP18CS02]|uniref:zinc-dependent alcohol dehydrogenase family protein n=1 Tax=Streptomyces sp. SP18CS02 TaxID=3002531 RepID=UPI002E79462A|nr:zinc-dependent alcohol dehydrogenase family protein [Streptomyces sp. SP18CS02]MEE1752972.1 zinc-dependent alcohol dehydrogenase family protein [Streptomyces sp. SP18CS02]